MQNNNILEQEVIKLVSSLGVPGAIVLFSSDVHESFLITYGYADIDKKEPMDIKLQYRIGSATKTFIGIVFLQLYQEGLINLDDPVSKYIMGIPNGDKITIRQIGLMRSGLFNYSEDPVVQSIVTETNPYRNWLPAELFAEGITKPPDFPPGTDYHYSNTNTVILGLIIERITGNSLVNEINKRIINPLNMNKTFFATNGNTTESFMQGYVLDQDSTPINVTNYNPSWGWAAGAIVSDISDITKYCKYAIGKHILLTDDAVIQQRDFVSCAKNTDVEKCYGFQLIRLGTFLGHSGGLPGYNSYILYDDNTNTSLTIIVNTQLTSNNREPADIIAQFIISYLQKTNIIEKNYQINTNSMETFNTNNTINTINSMEAFNTNNTINLWHIFLVIIIVLIIYVVYKKYAKK